MMESVYCNCRKCDSTVGLFVNLWTRIGKSYFSPVVDPGNDVAVRPEGAIRVGEPGTLVDECRLQDIVCANCAAILGLTCIETPVNHVLDENQILLRLASVELLSRDGQEVEFATKRVLDVKEPSRVSTGGFTEAPPNGAFNVSGFPEVVDLLQLQADLEGQREDINRIDSNGSKILSSLDARVVCVEESVNKLKDTFGNTRRDIGGVQDDLTSLKDEVNAVKRTSHHVGSLSGLEEKLRSATAGLDQVRQEVGAIEGYFRKELSGIESELRQQKQDMESLKVELKGRISARDHAKDMAGLRTELLQMRRQMDEIRSKATERVAAPFPSKELDILTSTIAKIGNRASQVETLQMEFEILKGRVERTEAGLQSPDRLPAEPRELPPYASGLAGQRKRTSSGLGKSQDADSASKRPAFTTNYASTPAQLYDVPSEWPAGREAAQQQEEPSPAIKLARPGKVDRRSQRTRKTGHGKKR